MLISKNTVQMEYINISSLLKNEIYLPIFQRGYTWSSKQITQLIEDLILCFEEKQKQIYLLDFIWFEENNKFKLADGQQRLVTLNILRKCINDYILEKNLPITPINLYNIIYEDENNQIKYLKFINDNIIIVPYRKVYLAFREFIESHHNKIPDIIYSLNNQIFIYCKKTMSVDDAFEIFKQINTGGKPLSKDEIIKTVLTQYSKKYNIPLEAKLKDLKKLVSSYYKLIENKYSTFDNLAIMSFLNNNIIDNESNFKQFAKYLETISNLNSLAIYKIIEYLNRPQIIDVINIMGIMGINLKNDTEYMQKVLLPLCLLSAIMTIKKVNPGGIITSLYSDIIHNIKNKTAPNSIQDKLLEFINQNKEICKIKFEDFCEGIGNPDLSQKVKKALLIMEVVISNISGSLNVDKIDLEHIFPQRPNIQWSLNGWPVSSIDRKKLINNIGNYLILNGSINKSIQNSYLDKKVPEYQKMLKKDKFLQTGMNMIDFTRFENEKKNIYMKDKKILLKSYTLNFLLVRY